MSLGQPTADVLSLPGFLSALHRHRYKALATFVVLSTLSLLFAVNRGRDYESSAKLFVRVGRETVSIDPTAEASGQLIHMTDTQEREVRSLVSLLSNRDLIEQVVDEVGPRTILDDSEPGQPQRDSVIERAIGSAKGAVKSVLVGCGLIEDLSDRERAIISVNDSLTIESGDSTSVIKVSARASSPRLAQLIVSKLIDLQLAYHLQAYSRPGSVPFFSAQTERLHGELEAASSQLAALKNENHVASLEAKKDSLERQMLSLREKRTQATADLASASSTVAALAEQLSQEAELVPSAETTGMANSAKAAMRQELYRLQIVESELLAKLKSTHPRVTEIRDQIEKARTVFEQEEPGVQTTNSINAIYQQLRINFLLEQARRAALESQIDALDSEHDKLVEEITRVNQGELKLADLEREVEVLDANYRRYVDGLEQVRINKELESSRISNVNVVQNPSLVEVPIGPSNLVILALGLIASACAAGSVAIWLEWLSPGVPIVRRADKALYQHTESGQARRELESVKA
jgi:uncharacterized protein involved in exopolysaccharide biosynthesis